MADSLIRLRQLNQTDLSGYMGQVLGPLLSGTGLSLSGNNLIPSGSGLWNLGSNNQPFNAIYTEDVVMPSGMGIHFGPYYFTAYTSGNNAVVQVGGFTITSSGGAATIAGPMGPSGATGATGPSGVSGIGITGATGVSGSVIFYYSNGSTGKPVTLPSGATGPSGVSLTGFSQSGNFARPLYSNGSSGAFLQLASGAQGPQGDIGGIYIDLGQATGIWSGNPNPKVYAPNLDPSNPSYNPDLHFIKGMRYSIGLSGLNTRTINGTGTNFFVDENGVTGYLRFCVFSKQESDAWTNLNASVYTGRIIGAEGSDIADLPLYIKDSQVFTNLVEGPYRSYISFNVNFGAYDSYYWGLERYNPDGTPNNSSTAGAYILGNLYTSYFGPSGPSGAQGSRGLDGAQGEVGPPGVGGNPGVGITGLARNPLDIYQIRFLFSDNTYSDWVTLPAGGPQGAMGPQGPAGSSVTGPTGPIGPQGLKGDAGQSDTYYANFNTLSINITGVVGAFNKQVSGQTTWTLTSGSQMYLDNGDSIDFQHDTLINKAYSPWLNLLMADGNYTGTRYFYAKVRTFDPAAGRIQLSRNDVYPAVGMSGGHMYWNQFNTVALNLGGLGSQGPSGVAGPTGAQGVAGNTGVAVFVNTGQALSAGVNYVLNCQPTNSWNLTMADDSSYEYYLNFNSGSFDIGQTTLVKIKNLGPVNQPEDGLMIHWDSHAKFPYGVPAPVPHVNKTNIYTFVRFPNGANGPEYYCTYSVEYS